MNYSVEANEFFELMGIRQGYIPLLELYHLFQQYLKALELPKEEYEIVINNIKNLEV